MKKKLIQLKEKFLSLSNVKKVMIISGSAVVLLGSGYAVSVLAGQTEKTQEVVQVAEVTTETTTTTENKELKDLQEKVAKASSEALKKEDKETLEKSIKDSKLSDKEKEDLIKKLDKVTLVEQTTSSEKKEESSSEETKTENKVSESSAVASNQSSNDYSSGSSSNSSSNSEDYSSSNNSSSQNNSYQEQPTQPTYTPEPAPVQTQAPAPVRLTALGNTGLEFATLAEAGAWLEAKMEESYKALEAGKQDWAYTGNYFEIPWSDGHTTASVNLRKQ